MRDGLFSYGGYSQRTSTRNRSAGQERVETKEIALRLLGFAGAFEPQRVLARGELSRAQVVRRGREPGIAQVERGDLLPVELDAIGSVVASVPPGGMGRTSLLPFFQLGLDDEARMVSNGLSFSSPASGLPGMSWPQSAGAASARARTDAWAAVFMAALFIHVMRHRSVIQRLASLPLVRFRAKAMALARDPI